jgi:hypothetical protein
VLNSSGDGLPPGVGGTTPGRDSQARQSSGTALWRLSIKRSYARAGTGACGSVENVRVGALERSGPRPRGRSDLERGGPRPRGGVEPSSEADPARGGVYPSSEAILTRGASAALHWRAAGATSVAVVLCICFRCASCFAFCIFLQVLSGFLPGYSGDP